MFDWGGSDGNNITNNIDQCYMTSDNPPHNVDIYEGIPDTAATKHYITEELLPICSEVQNTNGPYVTVADGDIMSPTKKAILPFATTFSRNAKIAYSFNNLKSGSLISIGQLCDDDCIAIFSKYDVKIIKGDKILIKGRRTTNGLWKIPIGTNTQPPIMHKSTNTLINIANGVI